MRSSARLQWTRGCRISENVLPTFFIGSIIMANNRIVHFEIPANQPEALTKFYSDLFGWKFQKAPIPGPEYWLCDTGSDGPGINGAVMQRQHAQQPWMNYVDVASIDAAIEKATKL